MLRINNFGKVLKTTLSSGGNPTDRENVASGRAEVAERKPDKASKLASSARWNINTSLAAYTVLAAVILLRMEGVSTQIVAPVAILGLSVTWLLGLMRSKRMYQNVFDEDMPEAREVTRGETPVTTKSPLTPKETIILSHIASGYINKEIAFVLGISEQTIKNHIYNIMHKLEVNDRTHAVVLALRNGWLSLDDAVVRKSVSVSDD